MTTNKNSKLIFTKQKQTCLAGVDLSRKGSIDEAIFDLVNHLNLQEDYVTTSSCSGRIAVFSYPSSGEVRKKGCKWLHISHDYCVAANVIESLQKCQGDAFFKFEAFVLHVQCSGLEHAQRLMATAVASGFRNSGISVSNKGKIVVAVRSTHSLEVPLTHEGRLLVSEEYIEYLVELGNAKMKENFERIERFFVSLKKIISEERGLEVKKKLSGAAKRRKKVDKTSSEGSIRHEHPTSSSKVKKDTDMPGYEGVDNLFNPEEVQTNKHGPLSSGLVSFNKVTSLEFTTQSNSVKKGCETLGLSCKVENCEQMDSNVTECDKDLVDFRTELKPVDDCIETSSSKPVKDSGVEEAGSRVAPGTVTSKALKGITAVTVIPSSNPSRVMARNIEDILEQALHIDSH